METTYPLWALPGKGSHRIIIISLLLSCGIILHLAESLVLFPWIPVRIGLANVVILIAFELGGPLFACEVGILRLFGSGIILGTLFQIPFWLGAAGLASGLIVMGILFKVTGSYISVLGISVWGAVSHMAAQIFVVSLWLEAGTGYLWVSLLSLAVVGGMVTGLLALIFLGVLKRP